MFAGHYAVSFSLKKWNNKVPLWLLFLAVQIVNIIAFLLVLLGIEKNRYSPSPNPFLRTIIEYVPYSHSLFTNAVLSAIVLLLFWKMKGKGWGIALSLGVMSHRFLDALVHLPDLPLFQDGFKVGLGLWKIPWLALVLELSVFLRAGIFLLKDNSRKITLSILKVLLPLGFLVMFFAPEAEATAAQASIMSLSLYSVLTALAFWSDRTPKFKGAIQDVS